MPRPGPESRSPRWIRFALHRAPHRGTDAFRLLICVFAPRAKSGVNFRRGKCDWRSFTQFTGPRNERVYGGDVQRIKPDRRCVPAALDTGCAAPHANQPALYGPIPPNMLYGTPHPQPPPPAPQRPNDAAPAGRASRPPTSCFRFSLRSTAARRCRGRAGCQRLLADCCWLAAHRRSLFLPFFFPAKERPEEGGGGASEKCAAIGRISVSERAALGLAPEGPGLRRGR